MTIKAARDQQPDAALKQRYSIKSEAKQSHTEEVTVKVPATTRLTIVFHWKRLWQHGLVQAIHAD
jgi:hypothetical protein